MDITPASLSELNTRYNILFYRGLFNANPTWSAYAQVVESTTSTESYPFHGKMPKFREWIGERAYRNIQAYDYRLKNRKFEATVEIPRESIEDDQYGLWDGQIEDLGNQAALWPDDIVIDALIAGSSSLCYDGQFFFDSDHPVDPYDSSKGVQANAFTGMPLTEDNYALGRARMQVVKDENLRVLGVKPTLLAVPAALEIRARKIVESEQLSQAGGSTQSNVLRGTASVLVIPQLDAVSVTDWYLFDTSRPVKPFLFQRRVAPEFQVPVDFGDHLAKTDKFVYGGRARGAAGYALWQLAAKFSN